MTINKDEEIESEVEGLYNDRAQVVKTVTEHNKNFANNLVNGLIGQDINDYFEQQKIIKEKEEKKKNNIFHKILNKIFKTF